LSGENTLRTEKPESLINKSIPLKALHLQCMKFLLRISSLLLVLGLNNVSLHAQQNRKRNQGREYLWTFQNTVIQIGFNAIDDDDSRFKDFLNTSVWSITPFPCKISLAKRIYGAYNGEFTFGFSSLKPLPTSDKFVAPFRYYFAEINVRYHQDFFAKYGGVGGGRRSFGRRSKFNLSEMSITAYPLIGAGFHHISQDVNKTMPTFHLGTGVNWWLQEEVFGINVQVIGKFGLHIAPPSRSGNLIHYSAGLNFYYGRIPFFRALFGPKRRNPYGN